MYRMNRVMTTRRRYRLAGCAGLLLFALACSGIAAYGVTVLRKYNPHALDGVVYNPSTHQHPTPPAGTLYISGVVFADDPKQQEAGRSVARPAVKATVMCNNASVLTGPDGGYSLLVIRAASYDCTAIASAQFAPVEVTIPAPAAPFLDLNFGPGLPSTCAAAAGSIVIVCPVLRAWFGLLTGTVTSEDTNRPMAKVLVDCWNPTGGTAESVQQYKSFAGTTDAQGHFSFASVPVDHYYCHAAGDWQLHGISVAPRFATNLDIAVCQAHCPAVSYHGGSVMHSFGAYVIYWLPKGRTYDSLGNDSYERITSNYFLDVGGTPFYNLLSQYWDNVGGPISNSVSLDGTYVDTTSYPHAATRSDPLTVSDIEHEVGNAIASHNWTVDDNHAFFVFTAYGAEVCYTTPSGSCSFSGKNGFCGFHSYTEDTPTAIYAEIVDNDTCEGSLYDAPHNGPNGDRVADDVIDTVSHEQFEAATDPLVKSWYDDSLAKNNDNLDEIGDKCYTDLSNVHLNHDSTYYIQSEWSDAINSCAFSL